MDHDKPSKFFSTEGLRNTMATSMFVGASLFSPVIEAQEQQTEPNQDPKQKTEKVDKVKEPTKGRIRRAERHADKLSAEERDEINQHMKNEGARYADRIVSEVGNSYSKDLKTVEENINTYFTTNEDFKDENIIIVDPEKFNAYGTLMNGLKGQKYDSEDVFKASVMKTSLADYNDTSSQYLGEAMTTNYSTDYADAHGHKPVAFKNSNDESMFMVPAPAHTRQFDIDGLTKEDELEFINLHEAYHTMDNSHKSYDIPPAVYKMESTDIDNYKEILNTEGATTYIEMLHQRECFADIAAIGDMIRIGGHDIEKMDKIAEWRADNITGYTHMSAETLDTFKKEINDMGIDNFKNLSNQDARKMYNDVVTNNAMDSFQFKKFFEAVQAADNDTPESEAFFEKWEKEKDTDPDTQRVDRFLEKVRDHTDCLKNKKDDYDQKEDLITEKVKDYDAMKAMTDKAYQIGHGRVTPESMVKAHGALQDDLRDMRINDPQNEDIYTAKMEMLQDTLIHDVPKMDYVCTNANYGVKPNVLKM